MHILVLNPNSSEEMTQGLRVALDHNEDHNGEDITFDVYRAPAESPASINDDEGIRQSTRAVLADLQRRGAAAYLRRFDGILVACYSVHPLVQAIQALLDHDATTTDGTVAVTGMFEASVQAALSLVPTAYSRPTPASDAPVHKWGIVTTGAFWEEHLTDGITQFLGAEKLGPKFAGVHTTGLSAGDFHDLPPEDVEQRLLATTQALLEQGEVDVVIMGCAGMAGLEEIIRKSARQVYGKEKGDRVHIVDPTKAGLLVLQQTYLFRKHLSG